MRFSNPDKTRVFIFPKDRELPEAEQTKFHLKTLNVDEEAFLEDRLGTMNDEGYSVKLGTQDLIAIHIGLSQVENAMDEDGNPVEFKRDNSKNFVFGKIRPWASDCLSRMSKEDRKTLAKEIVKGPKISEAEAKN